MKKGLIATQHMTGSILNEVHPKEIWKENVIQSQWWQNLLKLFREDTGGCIDRQDPEYSAQKIYQHWLKSYL